MVLNERHKLHRIRKACYVLFSSEDPLFKSFSMFTEIPSTHGILLHIWILSHVYSYSLSVCTD